MNPRILRCISLLLLVCFAAGLAAAQENQVNAVAQSGAVPRFITYGGILKDSRGQIRTGVTGVTFLLYRDEQAGGAPLWMETQNVVPDATGHYSVQLGATTAGGIPTELFQAGAARWLAVQIAGQAEQSRVLLVSVPYAMKAGDAETIGGLPPSAFVLALPIAGGNVSAAAVTSSSTPPVNPGVTGAGTAGSIPLWDSTSDLTSSVLTQTGSGSTARVGVNITTPATTLDVKGTSTFRGMLGLPSSGAATASAGKASYPFIQTATAFNSGTKASVNQTFRWQTEPVGNNTTAPGGKLSLLFYSGSNTAAETGLSIASNGQLTFASGQTFPGTGTGTVTSVGLTAPSSDFTVSGSPVTKSGTLNFAWNIAPTNLATANAIVKRDSSGGIDVGNVFSSGGISTGSLNAVSSSPDIAVVSGQASVASGPSAGIQGIVLSGDLSASAVLGLAIDGSATGVTGQSMGATGTGVYGFSIGESGTGVLGLLHGESATGSGHGYIAGVAGDSSIGIGVLGAADDSNAVVGLNNSPSGFTAAYFQNATTDSKAYVLFTNGSDFGGTCGIDVKGNLGCTGTVSATVSLDGGKRKAALSAIQSPKNWFEDAGSGELVSGTAVVALDPDFVQTANTQMEYQVFLTPYGDCKGLYVTNRTATSFEVHELGGGAASVGFGYRLMALRKNYESVRFADRTNDPVPFLAPRNKAAKHGEREQRSRLALRLPAATATSQPGK